jgi:molybdopterin synthase sulfur carrier subunit
MVGMNKPLIILYFAWLRERTGASHEEVALPDGVRTVSALLDYLSARSPGHAAAFQNRRTVRAAVNQEFADLSAPIQPGDEVAFFPPVTGG